MIYKCEYCRKEFGKDYECKYHEDNCEKNPIKKHSCKRCKFLRAKHFKYQGKWEQNYDCGIDKDLYYKLDLTNKCKKFKAK